MSCIKFPSSKIELSKVSNKENIDNNTLTNAQLISIANQVFGQDNWSHSITNQTLDFIDYTTGKYQAGCASIVRIQLKDGTFHEGMGYSNMEGSSKGSAIQKVRTISFKDAFKKAMICFGNDVTNKINRLSSRPNSPVSSENVQNIFVQNKPNTLTVTNIEPPVEIIPISQTDAVIDMVDLDQILNTNKKSDAVSNSKKANIDTSKPATCISIVVSKDSDVNNININEELEADICKSSVSTDVKNLNNKDKSNTVNSVKKDSKTEVSKTTVLAAISDEEMRLERKRKQRELQEEFKRKEEYKKKFGDNGSKQAPNPRY